MPAFGRVGVSGVFPVPVSMVLSIRMVVIGAAHEREHAGQKQPVPERMTIAVHS
ncbi:MAG: hypothetical protein ACREUZ_00805 [Burkholderiales bacterium]